MFLCPVRDKRDALNTSGGITLSRTGIFCSLLVVVIMFIISSSYNSFVQSLFIYMFMLCMYQFILISMSIKIHIQISNAHERTPVVGDKSQKDLPNGQIIGKGWG